MDVVGAGHAATPPLLAGHMTDQEGRGSQLKDLWWGRPGAEDLTQKASAAEQPGADRGLPGKLWCEKEGHRVGQCICVF
jgi:hypothetical protein